MSQPIPKVLPGDEIEMDVPMVSLPKGKARLLPGGHYNFTVDSVRPVGRALILQLSNPINLKSCCHVQFVIYPNSPKLGWGWGFLGQDNHPVQFQLVQSLSQRLKASVSRLEKTVV